MGVQAKFGGSAVYNLVAPTLVDDDASALRVDNKQRLVVTGEAASPLPVSAAAASAVHTPVSTTATASGQTTGIDMTIYKEMVVMLDVGGVGGTVPTFDLKVQVSYDNAQWFDEGTSFTQITAASRPAVKKLLQFGSWVRFVYTIGGTSPSFNFTIKTVSKT